MAKFDKLLDKLNVRHIECTSTDWFENIPLRLREKYFRDSKCKVVATDVDEETHKYYTISTTIVKIYGRYLAIRHISEIYSDEYTEPAEPYEIGYIVSFFEVIKKKTVTFVLKEF